MRTVAFPEFQSNPEILKSIVEILEEGGIVCVPTPSGYKLMADLQSTKSVLSMLQAKRRVKSVPSLVLIPDRTFVEQVAGDVSDEAAVLMTEFWPGPLTLLFNASDNLPGKVRKALTKSKGWVGVRVPNDETTATIVKAFGKPILVSSANISRKVGASSVAQVKKNFGRVVGLLVDNGDVSDQVSSTLVDVSTGEVKVVRPGAVEEERIMGALAS